MSVHHPVHRIGSLNAASFSAEIYVGTEGPRYDPYSYQEIAIDREGKPSIILHEGLGEWIKVDGKQLDLEIGEGKAREKFVELLGFTPEDIMKWSHRAKSRCPECGCRRFEEQSGYPGETFTLCMKCHAIVDSEFNEAAII